MHQTLKEKNKKESKIYLDSLFLCPESGEGFAYLEKLSNY
jgi:hypothetical protein